MSGATSRTKGAAAERELAAALEEQIGVRLTRRLDQARGGGHDLDLPDGAAGPVAETLRRLAVEVKRYQAVTAASLAGWWGQAVKQAAAVDRWPCLCYRADRAAWRVRLPLAAVRGDLFAVAWEDADLALDVALPGFAALVREGAIAPPPCCGSSPAAVFAKVRGGRPSLGDPSHA